MSRPPASIAQLFRDFSNGLRIAMLFISHDLAAVRRLATRVAVMYAGEIVETGPCGAVLDAPAHPYTRLLVAAMPDPTAPRLNMQLVEEIDRLVPTLPHCRRRVLLPGSLCIERVPEICASGTALAPVSARSRLTCALSFAMRHHRTS